MHAMQDIARRRPIARDCLPANTSIPGSSPICSQAALDEEPATHLPTGPFRNTTLPRYQLAAYNAELARLTATSHAFDQFADAARYRAHARTWTPTDEQARQELMLLSDPTRAIEPTQALAYDEQMFRQAHVPVLWSNDWTNSGWRMFRTPVVQWNHAAEIRFHDLIRHQMFPTPSVDCSRQKFILLPQCPFGFFSRWSMFIRTMMISLQLTDRMVIFGHRNMYHDESGAQQHVIDDLRHEGIARFFQPTSQCQHSEYVQDQFTEWGTNDKPVVLLTHGDEARPGGVHFDKQWVAFDHQFPAGVESNKLNAPQWLRRALFDFGEARVDLEARFQAARAQVYPKDLALAAAADARGNPIAVAGGVVTAEQILESLTSHSLGAAAGLVWRHFDAQTIEGDPAQGHIYSPLADAKPQYSYEEFFEILAYAYFWQPLPRIEVMRNLVSLYWSSMIARHEGHFPDTADPQFDPDAYLSDGQVAAVLIRRGDKCVEDDYCKAHHGQYRPASMFLLGVIDEERRQGKRFRAIYLMSDDAAELVHMMSMSGLLSLERTMGQASAVEQSTDAEIDAAIATHDDETMLRVILKGRWLLYNQFAAPSACYDPSPRWSFESFVTSFDFLLHHNAFAVGHENSNVAFSLARMLYVKNQHTPGVLRSKPGAKLAKVADKWPWE